MLANLVTITTLHYNINGIDPNWALTCENSMGSDSVQESKISSIVVRFNIPVDCAVLIDHVWYGRPVVTGLAMKGICEVDDPDQIQACVWHVEKVPEDQSKTTPKFRIAF